MRQSLVLRGAPLLTRDVRAAADAAAAPIFGELAEKYATHAAFSGLDAPARPRAASGPGRGDAADDDSFVSFAYDTGEASGADGAAYNARELSTLLSRLRALGVAAGDYARPDDSRDARGDLPVDVFEVKLASARPPGTARTFCA